MRSWGDMERADRILERAVPSLFLRADRRHRRWHGRRRPGQRLNLPACSALTWAAQASIVAVIERGVVRWEQPADRRAASSCSFPTLEVSSIATGGGSIAPSRPRSRPSACRSGERRRGAGSRLLWPGRHPADADSMPRWSLAGLVPTPRCRVGSRLSHTRAGRCASA